MIRGNFIVFEGIDGSGTTTQAALLRSRFEQQGLPAHVTAEPSAGPIGTQIRQILSGRLVVPRSGSQSSFDWQTMALLFAADRHDHVRAEIEPNMIDGVNVICDRYLYSSVIYQSTASGRDDGEPWGTVQCDLPADTTAFTDPAGSVPTRFVYRVASLHDGVRSAWSATFFRVSHAHTIASPDEVEVQCETKSVV